MPTTLSQFEWSLELQTVHSWVLLPSAFIQLDNPIFPKTVLFRDESFRLNTNYSSSNHMKSLRKIVFKFGRPISDHELPLSFTTNIRVVGLTNNFQLVRTFTFFFTIFNSNIRFYHFYEIDYRTRFLKFQATVNSFLLASQKPTNKFSWDCCKQWCKQGSTHWSWSVLNQSAPWLGNFEILGPEFCSSTWHEFPNSAL